ncbi:hypothetical protein P692DRAFT_20829531, partial [Suillus brevipes Sb2]
MGVETRYSLQCSAVEAGVPSIVHNMGRASKTRKITVCTTQESMGKRIEKQETWLEHHSLLCCQFF